MTDYREASDEEWEAGINNIIKKFDWDWGKYFPKRDTESWQVLANDFISDYKDIMNNYNEEDGMPGSRSSDELMEFFEFCVKYPQLRFFQALIAFIGRDLYVMDQNPDSTPGLELPGTFHSTFAWEKDSYERCS